MSRYTAYDKNYGKKIDKEIQKQLDNIVKIVVRFVNPISIILVGGFGRREGSIVYKKNKFIPINDYDIYVITSKKYPDEIIEEMCRQASKAINKECIDFDNFEKDMEYDIENTFYPDIRVLPFKELKTLPPFIKYFEMKNSMVIYGKQLLNEMPEFKVEDIPVQEGWRFLMNRLSLMIMHFSPKFIEHATESDRERIINFNMKTALTCAEALLLFSRKFIPSYENRAKILSKTFVQDFPELAKSISNLPKIVKKYTNQKLKPNYNKIKNPVKDWFDIRDCAGEIMKFLLIKFTGKKPQNWQKASNIINKSFSRFYIKGYIKAKFKIKNNFLLNLLSYPANLSLNLLFVKRIFRTKRKLHINPILHPFIPPDLKLFAATPLIIFSLKRDGKIEKNLFKKSIKYLKQVYFDKNLKKDLNWEEMRRAYGTAFRLYGFQKLI